jgi:hypothetical protein
MDYEKVLESLSEIEKSYFGQDSNLCEVHKIHDGKIGTYSITVGAYDDEYEFNPYSDQEEAKRIHNALIALRSYVKRDQLESLKNKVLSLESFTKEKPNYLD